MAFPIAALMALGQGAHQYIKSQEQKTKAKTLTKKDGVPAAVNQAVALAKSDMTSQSAGYTRTADKIQQSTATAINNAKRMGGTSNQLQQAVNNADSREKEAIKDLEVAESSFKNSAKVRFSDLLMRKGMYQNQAKNEHNAAKSALIGASEQNQYNALTNAAEGIVQAMPDSAFSEKTATSAASTGSASVVSPTSKTTTPFINKRGSTIDPKLPMSPEQLQELLSIQKRKKLYTTGQ